MKRLLAILLSAAAATAAPAVDYARDVVPFIQFYCGKCHAEGKSKGDFSFEKITAPHLGGEGAAKWVKVLKQIQSGEMPPEDKPQPKPEQTKALVAWLTGELRRGGVGADALSASAPTGNRIENALLFSGPVTAPLDNPPRVWRFSPEIYAAWVLHTGSFRSAPGQAMTPLAGSTFKDLASTATIDSATLAVVLRNAQSLAETRTAHTVRADDQAHNDGREPFRSRLRESESRSAESGNQVRANGSRRSPALGQEPRIPPAPRGERRKKGGEIVFPFGTEPGFRTAASLTR